jgi:hypothetical protein
MNYKNFRAIKIASYTSYNTPDKLDFLFCQGADYVLSKPISYEELENYLYKIE